MHSLRTRQCLHAIESSSLQTMGLELGALSGAGSDEGDDISATLGEVLEAEGMLGGRVFESHEFGDSLEHFGCFTLDMFIVNLVVN